MKKYNCVFIDDFLLEKYINQWIWEKMLNQYYQVFNLLFTCKYILTTDLSTYTTTNFKRFLWDNFILRKWSSTTYNHYRKCLKCYCKYLYNEWYIGENPFDKILKRKQAQQLPKTLTKEQLNELLLSLESTFKKDTYVWYRNIVIVYTYLYTWLRLSELINLSYNDLNLVDWYIRVRKWKWDKERLVPISSELQKILFSFDKFSNKNFINRDYYFLTNTWNQLSSKDLKRVIDKIRYWITFHFTWHQLRHTFATELVRNNFDIYNISQILWHSKIDTTKIYLSSDTTKLKKQLDLVKLFNIPVMGS